MESRTKISLRKKVAFSLASVLIFFTLLEISLKSWGIDPVLQTEDPFVGFSGSVPLYVNDTGTPGMMTTAANKRSHFNLQQFQRTKPANTFRIFCLGGSTTYGRPFDDATSFAGWLREFLTVADPKRSWEVLNAGGVSYASYRIVSLVEELIQYQPDLFVIYTGHNEFLETRSYPKLANMSPWLLKSAATAGRFRTFALLRKLIATPAQAPSQQYQMPGEVDEILNHTIGPSSYQRDDAKRAQVAKHFEFNLIRMVQLARAGGAKVLIVSPASNLKDCAPFKSQHRDGLSTDEKQRFDALLKQAHTNQAQEKLELALTQYKQAMAIDNRYADLHYQLAQLLLKKQQVTEALLASRRAQEEDICPLRALESIRDSIQRVAADMNVPLVDFHHLLAEQCQQEHRHRLPGQEYFLDHVHLRPEIHRQLAIHLVDAMIQNSFIQTEQHWRNRNLADIDQQVYGRVDEVGQATALRNLAKVLNWAGKHLEAGALALEALETIPQDAEALLLAAPYLKTLGRLDQAARYYQQALKQLPNHAEAHQLLAALMAEQGKYQEAKTHFLEYLRIHPDDKQAPLRVAILCTRLKQFRESLPYYRNSLQHHADNPVVHYHYAMTLANLGEISTAIAEYEKTIALDPAGPDAHFNLATLLEERDPVKSQMHYERVVQLNPQDVEAFFCLGQLLEKKDPARAIGYYQQALQIKPDYLPAQNRLNQLQQPESNKRPK